MSANFPAGIVSCVMEVSVAGCPYRADQHQEMRRWLGADYRLELWPEPENPHDRSAVRVMFVAEPGALHLGYIPRMDAPFILAAIHLGRGIKVAFKDVGTTASGDPYAVITIEIGAYQVPQPPQPLTAPPSRRSTAQDQPF